MTIQLSKYPVHVGDDALQHLEKFISAGNYSSVFVLTDENTNKHCYPHIENFLPEHSNMTVPAGEESKKYETCNIIWVELAGDQADRKSLLINLGGGVIGDLGGMAAGLYMRGIDFIHVPTTLLAQADASVGGKSGIDFFHHKNLIGLFNNPRAVFIYPGFLKTLPKRELISGYAEVIKHHLISDKNSFEKLISDKSLPENWEDTIIHSIQVKSKIAESDPFEKGDRKALNFGHTIGHAIESSFLQDGVSILLHGEAIAAGMICESFLSKKKNLLEEAELNKIISYLKLFFDLPVLDEKKMETILDFTRNDKKNEFHKILCTLLNGMGSFTINQEISREDIFLSMRFYNSYIQ